MSELLKTQKKSKVVQYRSVLDSKEESKLDTTYDKMIRKIEPLFMGRKIKPISRPVDYNSDANIPKEVLLTVDRKVGEIVKTYPIAKFTIDPKVENAFLHPEEGKVEMLLEVFGKKNLPMMLNLGAEMGELLNAAIKVEVVSNRTRKIDQLSLVVRKN